MYYVKIILLAAAIEVLSCLGINIKEDKVRTVQKSDIILKENQKSGEADPAAKNASWFPIHICIR